jgi:hypothetical protein
MLTEQEVTEAQELECNVPPNSLSHVSHGVCELDHVLVDAQRDVTARSVAVGKVSVLVRQHCSEGILDRNREAARDPSRGYVIPGPCGGPGSCRVRKPPSRFREQGESHRAAWLPAFPRLRGSDSRVPMLLLDSSCGPAARNSPEQRGRGSFCRPSRLPQSHFALWGALPT